MANEIDIVIKARDDASRVLKRAGQSLEQFSQQARVAAIALSALSVGGIALIKRWTSAAQEQKAVEQALQVAVENTGVAYADVKDKILDTVAALQQKTNFGDEEQMKALTLMIGITGDYEKALSFLPAVLDASAVKGRGVTMTAGTMTRALDGQTDVAISLGMTFDKTATSSERLGQVLGAIGGVAEAQADPLKQLGDNIGDLEQALGMPFLNAITPVVQQFREWTKSAAEADEKTLNLIASVIGIGTAAATLAVPIALLLALLGPIKVGMGLIVAAVTGPVGLIIAAIALLTAAVVIFAVAWETDWMGIQAKTEYIFGKIEDAYRSHWGWILPGGPLVKALLFLKDNWGVIWKGMGDFVLTILEKIAQNMFDFLNRTIGYINVLIDAFNLLNPFANIPHIQEIGGGMMANFDAAREALRREYEKFLLIGRPQDMSGGGATGAEADEFGGNTQRNNVNVIINYDGDLASSTQANLVREDNQVTN